MNDTELATIARILADAREILERSNQVAATLKAEREAAELSPAERNLIPEVSEQERERRIDNLWEIHERAYAQALRKRDELVEQMRGGLPVLEPLPNGGGDGLAPLVWVGMKSAIRDYTWASIRLHATATALVEEGDYEDDGKAEGIKWQVAL